MELLDSLDEWHILDAGSIWMKEFASALGKFVPTVAWVPVFSAFGHWEEWERTEEISNPPLTLTCFPLQRGYAHPLIGTLLPFQSRLIKRIQARSTDPSRSYLVCTTPFYAPIAELWSGKVVYYVTDLTKKYEGCKEEQVVSLDKRLCNVATVVCPNSRRIADYLTGEAGCNKGKITILPNATRCANLSAQPLLHAGPLPAGIADVKRPVAGVIGNLAGNMDWVLLRDAIIQSPGVSWVFVGPTSMRIKDNRQRSAREWVLSHARFTGSLPYGELQQYARAFDVAILPYRKLEPTYSGSSTRFYEHLAACRPMIGTRGFAELLEKQPLITLVNTAEELSGAIAALEQRRFEDGYEQKRWFASQSGTWEERAQSMITACSREPRYVNANTANMVLGR